MLDNTLQTCVRSANKLIQANIFTVAGIVILFLLGSHVSEQLSVISHPLFVTKLLCAFVVVVNLWLAAKLPDSEYSTTKPSKTSRFKFSKLMHGGGMLLAGSFLAHIIAVLFGAPFTQSLSETFHFAFLLASFTIIPCVCTIGPSLSSWICSWMRQSSGSVVEWGTFLSCSGAVVGAWLGAFPIPLDWDRPWQVWPISCIIGAVGGYCIGLLASSVYILRGIRRMRKSKST